MSPRREPDHQLEAIGRLAGSVAHDVNTLLCAIGGYALLLRRRLDEQDPNVRTADQILEAAQKAGGLVRHLLALASTSARPRAAVDVNTVVRDLEPLLVRLLGDGVALTTSLSDDLPAVRADVGELEQVLMNLVTNARDAMPQGGRLSIETGDLGCVERRRAPRESQGEPPRQVRLAVSDSGCGMDAATRARIFEPFFTTKGPDQGTGLGLTIVRSIITQAGGAVHVTSETDRGTTFEVVLPAAPRADSQAPGLARGEPHGTETVLVVEDEALLREVIGETLSEHGYTVLAAGDGEEALRMIADEPGRVDVLLADIVLPGLSGPQVAQQLAVRDAGIRVLYMSGNTASGHGDVTPFNFLPKPFTPGRLLQKLRSVLEAPPA
jgi:two-component system, cell cycle sensor histidine kinase and response regulator CckA